MPRFTISNIAKHISHNPDDDYENEDGTECVQFTWDYENEKIDKIASEEFRYAFGDKKKNLMWVQKLKEIADWKEGEYIYAYTKTNADGYYNVFYKKDKVKFSWFNTIIEPSGYVCMQAFNHYTMDTDDDIKHKVFVRIDSVYNDKNSVKPKEKAKPKVCVDDEEEKESFEEFYEREKDCRCCAWGCDVCQYRIRMEEHEEEEEKEAKPKKESCDRGVAIDNGEVPACATCGYEMDPFLICLLNFGNHNQSVYHCTECLDERAALFLQTGFILEPSKIFLDAGIPAINKAESDDEDSE